MQPETKLKIKVLKNLRELPLTWCVKIQQESLHGIPDILACIDGKFVAIELKRHKKDADPLQRYHLEKIEDAGGYSFIVYPENWPEVFQFLTNLAYGRVIL